jgi:hypothetical protein
MSTNNYDILPLLLEDLPTLAHFVQESKLGLTVNRLLFKDWPNDAAQKANYSKAVESNFDNPLTERWKVIDNESGSTVGHLVLTRILPLEIEVTQTEVEENPKVPDMFNSDVFMAVKEMIAKIDIEKNNDRFGENLPQSRLSAHN